MPNWVAGRQAGCHAKPGMRAAERATTHRTCVWKQGTRPAAYMDSLNWAHASGEKCSCLRVRAGHALNIADRAVQPGTGILHNRATVQASNRASLPAPEPLLVPVTSSCRFPSHRPTARRFCGRHHPLPGSERKCPGSESAAVLLTEMLADHSIEELLSGPRQGPQGAVHCLQQCFKLPHLP